MVSDAEVVERYLQALRERWMQAVQNDQDWDCKVQVRDSSGVPDGGGYKFYLVINPGRSPSGIREVQLDGVQSFESDPNVVTTYEEMFKQAKRFQGHSEEQIQNFWEAHLKENPSFDIRSQFGSP